MLFFLVLLIITLPVALLSRYPDLHRPFKIPLSTGGCIAMLVPAFFLLTAMLLLPVIRGQVEIVFFTFLAILAGSGLYPLLQYIREKGWFKYSNMTPEDFKVRHSR